MPVAESKRPARSCVFCGATSNLTREHVLPDWLTGIDLDLTPSGHQFGRLNRVPRQWSARPFTTTVKMVCSTCNSGWLSALEGAVKPVLQPLILGEARRLPDDDQALIAAWTCKTALVSLLQHSQDDRRDGYGVPPGEYTALYEQRDRREPLPFSQYWTGSYTGSRAFSIWITPFYPAALAQRTLRTGRHYVFLSGCECPHGYIIRTEADGAHMKRWGEPAAIEAAYEDWPGEEFVIEDDHGVFYFKEER